MERAEKAQAPEVGGDVHAQWMLDVKAGRPGAFEKLYDAYARRAFGFAFRHTGDRAGAKDLVQEAFLRVYRARETYRPTALFSTWFFRILVNLCLSYRRPAAGSLDGGPEGRSPAQTVTDAAPPDPAADAERGELRLHVRAAVAALPARQRAVVLLARFEGLRQAEVADAMGISEKAVKSLLARAREALRRKLARYL